MSIKKVISEMTWVIKKVEDDVIHCVGQDDGETVNIELSYDDFSVKDHSKIKSNAVVKEIEFYEDDEDGNRNHVIVLTFKEK